MITNFSILLEFESYDIIKKYDQNVLIFLVYIGNNKSIDTFFNLSYYNVFNKTYLYLIIICLIVYINKIKYQYKFLIKILKF